MEIIRKMEIEETEVEESEEDREAALTQWISGFKGFDPDEFLTFIIEPKDDIVSTKASIVNDSRYIELPL